MCQPGTYQDLEGQKSCKICTAGSYCGDSGMEDPVLCSVAHEFYYCPTGTIYPTKCEIGYSVVVGNDECVPCAHHKYCWPEAHNEGDGTQLDDCDILSGYLCRSGAFSPKPLIDGLEFIQPGSNQFNNYNGPVLGGYIADPDTFEAVACTLGTWQPSILSTACLDCYDGHYCPNSGMANIDEYYCAAGYFCYKGNYVEQPNPDDGTGIYDSVERGDLNAAPFYDLNGNPPDLSDQYTYTY